jgi:hypothetical protein
MNGAMAYRNAMRSIYVVVESPHESGPRNFRIEFGTTKEIQF